MYKWKNVSIVNEGEEEEGNNLTTKKWKIIKYEKFSENVSSFCGKT